MVRRRTQRRLRAASSTAWHAPTLDLRSTSGRPSGRELGAKDAILFKSLMADDGGIAGAGAARCVGAELVSYCLGIQRFRGDVESREVS